MNRIILLLFFLGYSLLSFSANLYLSEDSTKVRKPTVFQYLFSKQDVPKLVLKADWSSMKKNKLKIDRYTAQLMFPSVDTSEVWDIELSMRGKSRRRICDLPPLRVHFPRKLLRSNDIRRKYNTLKLVSYCKDREKFQYYIFREYMAYLMYNSLTDYSFNVKLVEIEYQDIYGKAKPVNRYGFFIENTDELAERLDAKEKAKYQLGRDSLNTYHYDVLALFQYLISNTDWRINALHNTKVIRDKETREYIAIPYDFDYSGFVNTEYSVPSPDFNQVSIYSRIYLGDCREFDDLESARQKVIAMKKEVMTCPEEIPFSKRDCKKALKFIKKSYKILENDKSYRKKCLKKRY